MGQGARLSAPSQHAFLTRVLPTARLSWLLPSSTQLLPSCNPAAAQLQPSCCPANPQCPPAAQAAAPSPRPEHTLRQIQMLPMKCMRCRLPTPRPGQVLGLVGSNGTGKSTALKILAGKLKPNLGRFNVS